MNSKMDKKSLNFPEKATRKFKEKGKGGWISTGEGAGLTSIHKIKREENGDERRNLVIQGRERYRFACREEKSQSCGRVS